MKKILFVTNHLQFSDGVANALVGFVNALDKEKFDITIMPIYRCDDEFTKKINSNVKIKKVFNRYVRGLDKIVGLLPYKFWYKRWIKEKYDIEVAFQYGAPTKLIAASKNSNAKHIAWMHGYGVSHIEEHKQFDEIICCSKSNVEQYKKVFSEPDKVSYLYNLIDDDKISRMAMDVIKVDKKYDFTFCTVGRLSPEKGFDRLLECHKRLMDEGLKHNLWIVGGGSDDGKLRSYIKENALGESAIMFGKQNNPYPYMRECDMFVCSSRREGFATVCVEAALIGKSILTTDVSGAKEFVADNNIGVMVDNDTEALYEGMKKILLDVDVTKTYEANLANVPDMHYSDRVKRVNEFFE